MTKKILLTSLLGLAIAGYAIAQEHPEHPKNQATKSATTETIVVGENICLGCALNKEAGAAAQCSVFGHRHALKVISATAAGKDLPAMRGWVLHYLETDHAQPYIKEHHGETLTMKGKVYADARVFEVSSDGADASEHPDHPKR